MAKDKMPIAFRRQGNALVPDMQIDADQLDGIAQGQKVNIEIKQWRNLDRLKAYWCTLKDCVDATGCAASKEALDAYVRPACGFVDSVQHVNGRLVYVPRHINLTAIDEPEMIKFFQAAEECLARDFGFVSERIAS